MVNMLKLQGFPFRWLIPSAPATPFPPPWRMALVQDGLFAVSPNWPTAWALSSPAAPAARRDGRYRKPWHSRVPGRCGMKIYPLDFGKLWIQYAAAKQF